MIEVNDQSRNSEFCRAFFRRFPPYAWLTIAAVLCVQFPVFYATRLLLPYLPVYSLSLPIDSAIPFRPEWIIIYFLSFVSWFTSKVIIISESKEHGYRFASAYIISLLISAAVFLIYPVTMERPEVIGNGPFMDLARFLYAVDTPTNLCPSLHVLVSYHCWRGTLECKTIPKWFKWFNFVFLILVCMSILLVKQHVIVDIPAALIIGEGAYLIAALAKPERLFYKADKKISALPTVKRIGGKLA